MVWLCHWRSPVKLGPSEIKSSSLMDLIPHCSVIWTLLVLSSVVCRWLLEHKYLGTIPVCCLLKLSRFPRYPPYLHVLKLLQGSQEWWQLASARSAKAEVKGSTPDRSNTGLAGRTHQKHGQKELSLSACSLLCGFISNNCFNSLAVGLLVQVCHLGDYCLSKVSKILMNIAENMEEDKRKARVS